MLKKSTLFIVILTMLSSITFAQTSDNKIGKQIKEPKSGISLLLGLTNYQGDLIQPNFDFGVSNFAFGVRYSKYFSDKFTGNLGVLVGSISGDDNDYESRIRRGFTLEPTSLINISLDANYHIWGVNHYRKDENTSIYVNAGLGLSLVNPEPTGIDASLEEEFSGSAFGVQIGGGLQQHFSERFSLAAELSYRPVFSDQIDGVSKNGNPDNIDTFVWIGLAATYSFGKK